MKFQKYRTPCGDIEWVSPCYECPLATQYDTCAGGYRCGMATQCETAALLSCETGCEKYDEFRDFLQSQRLNYLMNQEEY